MEAGVDRIVDQIVNPTAMEAEVESVIYRFDCICLTKQEAIPISKVLWDNEGG